MTKKITSLLLALLLLFSIMAGCNTGNTETSATPPPTSSTPDAGTETDTPPTEKPALPLVDEPLEFTCYLPSTGIVGNNMTQLNDSYAYKKIEEMTNVHLKFQHPSSTGESEAFSLMIASNELTDLIVNPTFTGSMSQYVADGYFLDLTDYIDEYAPNYQALRESNPNIMRGTMDDDSRISTFAAINDPSYGFLGYVVRQDWMEEAGITNLPVTYDDWHDMLLAMKEKTNIAPLFMMDSGAHQALTAGFGTKADFYNKNGKVEYGPVTDEFKQYLTLMRGWYEEGIIDPDFYTRDAFYMVMGNFANGDWAASPEVYSMIDMASSFGQSTNPDFKLTAIPSPRLNANDKFKIDSTMEGIDYVGNVYGFVSTVCQYPEIAIRYFDFFYSEEIAMLTAFGIEGFSYEIIDGEPTFMDGIYDADRGDSLMDIGMLYAYGPAWPRLRIESKMGISESSIEAQEIWSKEFDYDDNYVISTSVSMTSQESADFGNIMGDVQTLIDENLVKIITGQLELSAWDNVVAQIKNMNIDKAISLKQAACDRYMNRGQ